MSIIYLLGNFMSKKRPSGVSVTAVLNFIAAALLILLGLGLSALSAVLGEIPEFQSLVALSSIVLIVVGVFIGVVAHGIWTGKEWAYYVALILWILSAASLANVTSIVPIVFIIYFLKRNVQDFFGVNPGWSW